MTDEMMSLQALLEKSSDTDLLREMIGFAAHRLMELEVENLTPWPAGGCSARRPWIRGHSRAARRICRLSQTSVCEWNWQP